MLKNAQGFYLRVFFLNFFIVFCLFFLCFLGVWLAPCFLLDFYGFFVFFVKFACKKYERTKNEGRKYDKNLILRG